MVFTTDKVAKVKASIAAANTIVLTVHKGPDGDALGSSLGFYHMLRNMGKEVIVCVPDAYPNFLLWLPASASVMVHANEVEKTNAIIEQADLLFVMDYNHLSRVGAIAEAIEKSKSTKVIIDHHQQPDLELAEVVFSDTDACSTAQMVYDFAIAADIIEHLDANAADCLYCGIMTDSGSFRFPSTTAHTHKVIAGLIEAGAKNSDIHEKVYDTNSFERLKLVGYVLDQKMKYYPEYNTVLMGLSEEELKRFSYKKGDTEGLVNYGLSIDGVVLSIFVRESKDIVKMSFRSKGDFSVNKMARKHFSGGGHNNAAGGKSDLSVEETLKQLIALLPQYSEDLHSS